MKTKKPTVKKSKEKSFKDILAELRASSPHPSVTIPIRANITLESTKGTPAIAGMIAHLLIEAGATVVLRDPRISIPSKKPNLEGLEVNLGRLIWIREEEADRWDMDL